ncbi:SMI1/KNR4 family protein [Burkholderia multivorans]|uniref:SMI1/KNR4 family protein n=1 Tax=Burkholderia multivorans TaxID=87883 RepID=UPI0019048B82|nr:SMI1/KNR4 family protein [Burkholderia multivorans]MBJ9621825.1 SMI1/KNR4 family protein [Burkholderia multivorans]
MDIERLVDWHWNKGASDQSVLELVGQVESRLPDDYLALMRRHNGGEGFIGNEYLMLWRVEDIVAFNREYEVAEYAPGLLLFGSNGGGEAYAFDTRDNSMRIVQVPFVGMDIVDAIPIADSIAALLSGASQ